MEKSNKKNIAKYFSHDYNARRHPSMIKMFRIYGMVGNGIFWALVEDMRNSDNYKLKLSDIDDYAFDYRVENGFLKEYISYCINDCELFKSDNVCFWSDTFLERMEKMENKKTQKSYAGKKGASERWINKKKPTNIELK